MSMRKACLEWLLIGALLSPSACQDGDTPRETSEDTAGSVVSPSSSLSISISDGPTLSIQQRPGRWHIESAGKPWGTLKLDKDRVKLKQNGVETAKAKLKDYGFKVYAGERELFKVKRRDAGFSVQRADGTQLGRMEAERATFGSETLEISAGQAELRLQRGEQTVAVCRGPLPKKSALLMLGVQQASLPQRLVMLAMMTQLR